MKSSRSFRPEACWEISMKPSLYPISAQTEKESRQTIPRKFSEDAQMFVEDSKARETHQTHERKLRANSEPAAQNQLVSLFPSISCVWCVSWAVRCAPA